MDVQAGTDSTVGRRFHQAATIVLAHLSAHAPMGLWAVSRLENGRQTYLYLADDHYGLVHGDGVDWADSYCRSMVTGESPRVAPRAQDVPLYRAAAVNAVALIGSYIGVPIHEPDGTLFGTVCGVDPGERGPELHAVQPLLETFSALLDVALAAERDLAQAEASAARARHDAEVDVLTGLLNRRGWERAVAAAGARVDRLGDPTVVVSVDLDGLKQINDTYGHAVGDDHIRRAARTLAEWARASDVIARLGGDEFGLVLTGCDRSAAPRRVAELRAALDRDALRASVGWASVGLRSTIGAALREADSAMYQDKDGRRSREVVTV